MQAAVFISLRGKTASAHFTISTLRKPVTLPFFAKISEKYNGTEQISSWLVKTAGPIKKGRLTAALSDVKSIFMVL